MSIIKFSAKGVHKFISKDEIDSLKDKMNLCNKMLEDGSGKGSDFLGWVNLPSITSKEEIEDIKCAADKLRSKAEIVVVIGIGGSYLGAKAVLDALSNSFNMIQKERKDPIVLFAGQNISEDYMSELLEVTKNRELGLIVISKSGTTTEPAIAFRILKEEMEIRYGKKEASSRIVAITDAKKGALRSLADKEGYKTFVIEDNIGGRFSVLTPVGLLPLAVAGIDIEALINGAKEMEKSTNSTVAYEDNIAAQYAATRFSLYNSGKKIEILASYEPKLQNINEWWKQLYGESEGKENKGIFPASVTLTSDLHSMGQYIQEGERILFETVISVNKSSRELRVKSDDMNLDGLNFLSNKRISEINHNAEIGTMLAHIDGGVPNIKLSIDKIDAYTIGALLYFFERACGISGYALGVNPFDQPGVEAYKKNMFALLGKPGFEKESADIRERVNAYNN